MIRIKHTICPSCSVGCGISIIADGDDIGTYPYKRHPINEGKNCLNGRNSIDIYKNRMTKPYINNVESDFESAVDSIIQQLKSKESNRITVLCSGNNTNEEIVTIKNFAESQNYNIAVYADNMAGCDEVASYEDIENASKVIVIGDLLYENPLVGRKIVHAKQNGAKIITNGLGSESISFNISDECSNLAVKEFINKIKGELDDSSVIVINYVDNFEDFANIIDVAKSTNSKVLPMYSKPNTKGALITTDAISKEELDEILTNSDILLIFNENIDEIDFDFKSIPTIISFSPCKNKTTEISQIAIPIKSWLECNGSFTNAMGSVQEFNPAVEICEDIMSEIEVIEKIQEKL